MKGVQCSELFGGIALKNHTFSFFHFISFEHTCFVLFTVDLIIDLLTSYIKNALMCIKNC